MKKLLVSFFLLAFFSMAAQGNDGWDDWQKTSCYSKIAFRLKALPKNGEQYHWMVQFKSSYPELISFNYTVTDKLEQYNSTTHRKTLAAGRLSDEVEIFTEQDDIFLIVDKVSLSPYPQDFLECDK